jgi:para-nitrobenzyl esterase
MLIGDPPTLAAQELFGQIRGAWTAFAANGDPGWPSYDAGRSTRIFDERPVVVAYPAETSRRLWRDHTFAALPLLVR